MGIRVRRGMLAHMVGAHSGHCRVQVQDADDFERVTNALRAARDDVYGIAHPDEPTMPAPNFVEVDADAEGGPVLVFDMHDLDELMPTVLKHVKRRLIEAGVREAVIGWPELRWPAEADEERQRWEGGGPADRPDGWYRVKGGSLHAVEGLRDQVPRQQVARAVILRVFPMPPTSRGKPAEIPDNWLSTAADWITHDLTPKDRIWASYGDQFRLPSSAAQRFLKEHRRKASYTSHLVSGDIDNRIRAVNGSFGGGLMPNIAIAGGGPTTSDDDLVGIAQDLIAVARSFADQVGYAFITIDPTFGSFYDATAGSDWATQRVRLDRPVFEEAFGGSAPPPDTPMMGASPATLQSLCDEFVFDAFPYQVLSPRHLQRLGGVLPGSDPFRNPGPGTKWANSRTGCRVGRDDGTCSNSAATRSPNASC